MNGIPILRERLSRAQFNSHSRRITGALVRKPKLERGWRPFLRADPMRS